MKKNIEPGDRPGVKVVLSVRDRVHFQMLSLIQGSRIENALSQAINKRIDFTKEERKEMNIVSLPSGRTLWDSRKEKAREFIFEPHEVLLIQQGINQRDAAKMILNDRDITDLADRLMSIKLEPAKE